MLILKGSGATHNSVSTSFRQRLCKSDDESGVLSSMAKYSQSYDLCWASYDSSSFTMYFNAEQIDVICESLYLSRESDKLFEMFHSDANLLHYTAHSSSVQRAYLLVLLQKDQFGEFASFIESNKFDPMYHEELQNLWYEAKYAETSKKRDKALVAVDKYRLRKKYPPPLTISDGQERIYSFKESARKVLQKFYKKNRYPSMDDKREIARQTQLKPVQIANWFKNRRQREKTSNDIVRPYYSPEPPHHHLVMDYGSSPHGNIKFDYNQQ